MTQSHSEKPHYLLLDGMRGVAAIAVVTGHAVHAAGELYPQWQRLRPMGTPLAVDFFFCLSGFVIAYAYDARFRGGMPVAEFVRRRLIRLYPMIALSVAIEIALKLVNDVFISHSPPGHDLLMGVASWGLVPLGLLFNESPYINVPMWSLFFEFLANGIYGFNRGMLTSSNLAFGVLAAISGLATLLVCLFYGIAQAGWYGYAGFVLGFVRIAYPFLAGLLIYRLGLPAKAPRLPDLVLMAGLAALLFAAPTSGYPVYSALAVLLAFPLLVTLGAQATIMPALKGIWRFLGDLSYPLYLIHPPVISSLAILAGRVPGLMPAPLLIGLSLGLSIAAAYVVWKLFDRPVRGVLSRWAPAA